MISEAPAHLLHASKYRVVVRNDQLAAVREVSLQAFKLWGDRSANVKDIEACKTI